MAEASSAGYTDLLSDLPPDEAVLAGIAERIRNGRVARFQRMQAAHTAARTAQPGPDEAGAFFRGLETLAGQAGPAALAVLHSWPMGYFGRQGAADPGPACARLLADLLFAALPDGSSPLAGLHFTTPLDAEGALPVLGRGGRLTLRGLSMPGGTLAWRCDARSALVWELDSRAELALPLPLAAEPGGAAAFEPNAVAPGLGMPVIDDRSGALFGVCCPAEEQDGSDPALPLDESLGRASGVLRTVWPGVIAWLRTLAPAFVDLGTTGTTGARLSGSFAPGEPIYLSQVSDPLCHAEDVIHEVQHLRFIATIPAGKWFGRWRDGTATFASPYRPDLRPLAGVHLGLHAFVAVTEFRLRVLERPELGRVGAATLLDTHYRNVFALRTVARHETLSAAGRRYYGEIAAVLARQHRLVQATAGPAERARVLDTLRCAPTPDGAGTAENAGVNLAQDASVDEIAALIGNAP